ncbi:MAG: hypothetical protein JXN64_04340 [Spirochaetes bacterium]|nr:hypothetical protein [Spirochaetota bacterium]
MNGSWYSLTNLEIDSQKNILAKASVPADSPWFSGHFPGEPILPGIAELSIIFDLIKNKFKDNSKNLKIISLKKVRFKFLVKPEEMLNIFITSMENISDTYTFKILKEDNIACMGIITVEDTENHCNNK